MVTPIINGNPPDANSFNPFYGNPISQLAFEQVKSDSTNWTNTDYLGADIFSDANGAKNTIDTTATTAIYDIDNQQYTLGFTDEASGDATHDPDSVTNPENAFDNNDGTFADKTTSGASLGKTFTQKFVALINFKADALAADNGGSASGDMNIHIETFNGSTWDNVTTFTQAYSWGGGGGSASFSKQENVFIDASVEGVRVRIEVTGAAAAGNQKWYTIEYGDYDSSSIVETDTIVNEKIPDGIIVYGKVEFPANTSATVDVSDDGGATFSITGESFNSYIDTSSLSGTNLALRFNLATTDTEVTPKLLGYGLFLSDFL